MTNKALERLTGVVRSATLQVRTHYPHAARAAADGMRRMRQFWAEDLWTDNPRRDHWYFRHFYNADGGYDSFAAQFATFLVLSAGAAFVLVFGFAVLLLRS